MGTSEPDDVAKALEAYLRREAEVPIDDVRFDTSVDLFELGYVDSAGVVALVSWIESHFEIELADEDLFDERFSSIDGIAELIAARQG